MSRPCPLHLHAECLKRDGVGGAGPGGRIGHSMVLAGNDTRVILFGGRDNDTLRQHIPKTYEVNFHASVIMTCYLTWGQPKRQPKTLHKAKSAPRGRVGEAGTGDL